MKAKSITCSILIRQSAARGWHLPIVARGFPRRRRPCLCSIWRSTSVSSETACNLAIRDSEQRSLARRCGTRFAHRIPPARPDTGRDNLGVEHVGSRAAKRAVGPVAGLDGDYLTSPRARRGPRRSPRSVVPFRPRPLAWRRRVERLYARENRPLTAEGQRGIDCLGEGVPLEKRCQPRRMSSFDTMDADERRQ